MTEPDDQAKPRKPVVHYVGPDEKIIMRPTPYTLGIVEGVRRVLAAFGPVSTNIRSWLGEAGCALARYRAFLKHARKPSSHDEASPRHGVWPTCGPNCAAYIAHNFPGTLGLFCRTRRLRPHMSSAKP